MTYTYYIRVHCRLHQYGDHRNALVRAQAAAGAAAAGATIPSSPLPASYLLGALSSGAAAHGVHVNEFVPGLRAEYKLIGLQTERLGAVVRAAGAGETSGEAGAASSSRADGQLV